MDLENIFIRSHTLFVKKVAVKRWFWYIVAAIACCYKTATQFFTSASTLRFYADLDFVPAPTKFGCLLKYAILIDADEEKTQETLGLLIQRYQLQEKKLYELWRI